MNMYNPEKLVAVSRYQNFFPTLSPDIQRYVYSRMAELIAEEKWIMGTIGMAVLAAVLAGIMSAVL